MRHCRVVVAVPFEPRIILLVEDSEDDVLLIQKAFTKGYIDNPLQVARSGAEAIDYLDGQGKYADRQTFPLPILMLLDLKMPGIDGFQVLEWLRSQPSLSGLRVVVLTSSEQMRDVNRAYQLGANSFLVKPADFQDFVALTRMLRDYWLACDHAPTLSSSAQTQLQGPTAS